MKLPTLEECEKFMAEFDVPQNVREHSEVVRKVANFLAQKMVRNKIRVDLECVDRAALLHDLAKMYCIKNNCRHALQAEKILDKKGFGGLGEIVRMHGLDEVLKFGAKTPIEAKIVWYADKRVNHGKVVSLATRYNYLKGHYGSMSGAKMEEIISTEKKGFALEQELLSFARVGSGLEGLE